MAGSFLWRYLLCWSAWHGYVVGLSPIAKVVRFYNYSNVYQSVCPLACKVGVAFGRQERHGREREGEGGEREREKERRKLKTRQKTINKARQFLAAFL
jgi:hypothetical protein